MDSELKQDLIIFLRDQKAQAERIGKFNEGLAAPHGQKEIERMQDLTMKSIHQIDDLIVRLGD